MPLSGHPPRRSQRAAFPHWAPASGNDAQTLFGRVMVLFLPLVRLPYSPQRILQVHRRDVGVSLGCVHDFSFRARLEYSISPPSRRCVRNLLCWRVFPSAKPLGSTPSADGGAPPSLFGRFSATISLSDFPSPCVAVVLLSDSQRGPWGHLSRSDTGPPGSRVGNFDTCTGSSTTRKRSQLLR